MPETPGLHLERELWASGFNHIAGVDEAGRGAVAGPVMAGAVILPPAADLAQKLSGVRDSKKMNQRQREYWAPIIKATALAWAIGTVSAEEIDTLGILPANRLAMQRAIQNLQITPTYHLFDFIHWKDCPYPGQRLVKGETHSLSIAAASVIVKTERDALMAMLGQQYPQYGLAKHKGYGTKSHREAIQQFGPSQIHRKSFVFK